MCLRFCFLISSLAHTRTNFVTEIGIYSLGRKVGISKFQNIVCERIYTYLIGTRSIIRTYYYGDFILISLLKSCGVTLTMMAKRNIRFRKQFV